MKICPYCKNEVEDDSSFCGFCGKKAPHSDEHSESIHVSVYFCPYCGTPNDPAAAFCGSCGSRLHEESSALTVRRETPIARVEPVSVTADEGGKKRKKAKGSGKGGLKFRSVLNRLAQFLLIAAILFVIGFAVIKGLQLGASRFDPVSADKARQHVTSDDGTLAFDLEFVPETFRFTNNDTATLNITVENLSDDPARGMKAALNYPGSLDVGSDAKELSIDSLGPHAKRVFSITVGKPDGINKNFTKLIALIAIAAVLTAGLIIFYAILRKNNVKLAKRIATFCLALVMLASCLSPALSSISALAEEDDEYIEQDGLMMSRTVKAKTNGAFSVGKGLDGKLSFDITYSIEEHLSVTAEIIDGMLRLSWLEINDAEGYEVYRSYDGVYFDLIDTVSACEYKEDLPYSDSPVFFRVAADLKNNKLYSNDLTVIVKGGEKIFSDGDSDLLSDELEKAFGTSPAMEDTDGDGLSDFFEITTSMTDPLNYDTDGSGMSDGEEDPDEDGLTSAEEQELKTSPLCADSDGDGLTDGDEVNVYGTDPINIDTDDDGLFDGTEVRISSDPRRSDSYDGGQNDAANTFTAHLNDERSGAISLDVTDTGVGLSIAEVSDISASCTIAGLPYVATPVVYVTVSDQSYGSLTLPITNPSEEGGEIVMGVYNTNDGGFRILEDSQLSEDGTAVTALLTDEYYTTGEATADNGSTVPARTEVYCAFYVANWHMQFEAPLAPDREGEIFFDVEFVIDESSSMEDTSKSAGNDVNRYRVSAAKTFISQLLDGDRAAVVGFNEGARRKTDLTYDLAAASAAVDTIVGNAGGTALYSGLWEALNELINSSSNSRGRFIIALTDGEDSYDGSAQYEEIIAQCTQHQIPIYTIALGTSVNTDLLIQLASFTGGAFFHIHSAEDLPQAFNRIQNNAFYGEDTDGDGLADKVEEYGIRDGRGIKYYTDSNDRFTDDDDLDDGDEAGNVMYCQIDSEGNVIEYYVMLTDPTKADTDGDGLDDLDEKAYGTLPWCYDTDQDGLSDGFEVSIGYNPTDRNPDRDSFDDGVEYQKAIKSSEIWSVVDSMFSISSSGDLIVGVLITAAGHMDPFSYDLDTFEKCDALLKGAALGDFGDCFAEWGLLDPNLVNSIYYCIGSMILDFIPGVEIFTGIRDAVGNLLSGDLLGVFFSLVGMVPEVGGALKAVVKVLEYLGKVYSAGQAMNEYVGKKTSIVNAPAITYLLLNLFSKLNATAIFDFDLDSTYALVDGMLEKNTYDMTKESVRNFELFLDFANNYDPVYITDIAGDCEELYLSVTNKAMPIDIAADVRAQIGTVPGGVVEDTPGGKRYTLVRVFDLETCEYRRSSRLDYALRDAVNRTANYAIAGQELSKRLVFAFPDVFVSNDLYGIINGVLSYAAERGVEASIAVYYTADDPANDRTVYDVEEAVQKQAIIILPGITGSELIANEDNVGYGAGSKVKAGDQVWLPFNLRELCEKLIVDRILPDQADIPVEIADMLAYVAEYLSMLQMDRRGKPLYDITGKVVDRNDWFVGALNSGKELYTALYDEFYDENDCDVVFYSYDWRNSVTDSARELEIYINNRGYEKVTLVCHSMGGVVASCYLARNESNLDKVDKVITAGTPYGGASKALLTLQTGKFIDNMPLLNGVLCSLSYNMPAVYDLLPYNNTVDTIGGYVYVDGNIMGSAATGEWIKQSAVGGDLNNLQTGLNAKLYNESVDVQRLLYASGSHIMNNKDLDAYIIAGYDNMTTLRILESNGTPTCVLKTMMGDGTVPLASAVLTNGEYFDNPIYYVSGVDHSKLISDGNVIALIKEIIHTGSGSSTVSSVDYITDTDVCKVKENAAGGFDGAEAVTGSLISEIFYYGYYDLFVAHCPVVLSLVDPDGNVVGKVGNAGIVAEEGYYEYFETADNGETKMVVVPPNYTVNVEGTDEGTMDVQVISVTVDGIPCKELSFSDINVSEGSTVRASIGDCRELTGVTLEVSGNGGSYTLTESDAEVSVFESPSRNKAQTEMRKWILIGSGALLTLAAILAIVVITAKTKVKKNKEQQAA